MRKELQMTKTELLAYKNIKSELQDIEKRIDELRKDARNPKGISYSDMPRGRGGPISSQQRYIEQLEELSQMYEEKKADLVETQIVIERAISSLPSDLRLLMRYRYIDGLRWGQVNDMMYISETQSKKLHRKALEILKSVP